MITIGPATTGEDFIASAALFRAYAADLPINLAYQDFEAELAALPGKYAAPRGIVLLAKNAHGASVGCIALRPMAETGCCEMKRLYVAPAGRGTGLGRQLADAVIAEAKRIGYAAMRLDTLASMTAALALYRSLGFVETPAYYDTPIAETVFLRLAL